MFVQMKETQAGEKKKRMKGREGKSNLRVFCISRNIVLDAAVELF